ncbi:hypothetical protein Q3G72_021737 [Acer saccharum]|nr:hypothetical protein Q3G72_021737 [Acer saccharum]
MWKCPDFFPIKTDGFEGLDTSARGKRVKYVLKNSLDETNHDYYTIGTYDTFFDDEKKRRILWGWTNESSSVKDDVLKGWSGIQAIPMSVWLDKSGKKLLQWSVKEIKNLHENQVKWPSKILEGGSKLEVIGVTAGQVSDLFVSNQPMFLPRVLFSACL